MHFRLVVCSCRRTTVLCTDGERRDKLHGQRTTSVAMVTMALQSPTDFALLFAPRLKPSFFHPFVPLQFHGDGQAPLGAA